VVWPGASEHEIRPAREEHAARTGALVNDVFLLGAGFSVAAQPLVMPTTRELGQRVITRQRSIHAARVKRHSDMCDGLSCDGFNFFEDTGDFETWLSQLSEPLLFLHGPENERRHALYEELVGLVALEIEIATELAFEQEPPDWLLSLAGRWHEQCSEIITLNYDTFVEASADRAVLGPPAAIRPVSELPFRPALIPRPRHIVDGRSARNDTPTLSLWKLHGSVRWYWDALTRSSDSMVDVGQFLGWDQPSVSAPPEGRAPGKVPVIVPPTFAKTPFFTNGTVRQIWRGAFDAVRRANRLFVLGYSLPAGDLLVRSLLGQAIRVSDPELWIVGVDAGIAARYEEIGAQPVTRFCGTSTLPIPNFATWYVNESLA
jgi:hypothetical protein